MKLNPKEPGSNASQPTNSTIFYTWKFSNLSSKQLISRLLFFSVATTVLLIVIWSSIYATRWVGQSFAGFMLTPRLVVANVGLPYWSGMTAGLKYSDKILTANGNRIKSIKDLITVIKSTRVGDPIRFTLERQGKTFEAAVPTMFFTWLDLMATFGLEFIAALAYISIGIIVFILKPDTPVSWSFLLLCAFLSLYNIADFDKGSTGLAGIYMLAMTFIPGAGIHLSLLFPERRKIVDRFPVLHYLPYMLSAILFVPLFVIYPRSGFQLFYQLSLLYLLFAAVTLVTSTFYSYVKSPSGMSKQRGKVVLFGAVLAFPLPAINHYVSLFGANVANLELFRGFSPVPIVIFPASIAFAIAKHNLFDVDVYIKRAVGYVIMTAIVGFGYFSIQTVITNYVFKPLFGDLADEVFPIAFALLVVFGFDPINRKIQSAVDRIFFRAKVDYKETVRSVSNALASLLNLDQILARVVETLRREMFIDAVGVFVLEPQKAACRNYFDSDDLVTGANRRHELAVKPDDPLVALLSREKKLMTKYDIAEDPRYALVKDSCDESFARVAGSLAVPLIYQGEVTGILTLGHKKSGHFFTREDIDLLDTLADAAAVAIENARLAEQMKKEETVRTNLSRYLSPQIVDQIVKNDVQVNLGGDKKVVTVLFSDIRNFTTITESRKPDELVQQLNEYFTEMAGIIFEHGGSLDKYIGDAIVAVFGSLIDLENSARNAAQAALKMMQRLPALNEQWLRKYGLKMEFGIGLNTGEVFLGNIGSPERMEFTVIGDTVNVASRFSGLAKPGQILITRDTYDQLGAEVRCRALPPAEVKGKSSKLEVFELLLL